MVQLELLAALELYSAENVVEDEMLRRTRHLLETAPGCFFREHYNPGHITGSAWVISTDRQRTLLTHHRRLNRWLQLGGHLEREESPLDAAIREAREESGLAVEPATRQIFDIDVHPIPARHGQPMHYHYDIRYCCFADAEAPLAVSDESHALAWVTLEEAERLNPDESIARLIRKTRALRP